MKKVIATNYGHIHYHAGCSSGCDFSDAIGSGRKAASVRNAVRSHVLKTGHECWIEAGKHTTYSLKAEAIRHADELERIATRVDRSE